MKKNVKFMAILCAVLILAGAFPLKALAYDGEIDQGQDHSGEDSMYLYTVSLHLTNPCNSKDMDKDAICDLYFDFEYLSENGSGAKKKYRLDMSWKNGRNLNSEIVKKAFIRNNDNSCTSEFKVWVPGLLTNVKVHLNMDGGERLTFYVDEITLNGFRVNTDTDYVSSAYWDSDASVPCRVTTARTVMEDPSWETDPSQIPETGRDQFGGKLLSRVIENAKQILLQGSTDLFYHIRKGERK